MHEMHKKSEHNEIKTVYVCVCMSMVTLCTDCERAHSNGKTKPDTQKRVRRNHHAPEMVQMYTYTAENEQKTRQDEMKRSTWKEDAEN